jgi:hypothetical protein
LLWNSFVQLLLVILLIYLIISYYYGQHEEYIQEQVKNCTLYPWTFYSENIGCECPPPDYAIENRLLNPKENYVTWKIMVQYCTNIESTQKAENIKCNEQFPWTMFYIIDGRCKCPWDWDWESTYNESKKSC